LVVGIGNDFRGDDAIGLEVARWVRNVAGRQVDVLESAGDVGQLLDAWTGRRLVLLVDAVVAGSAPGTIVRFDALKDGILPGVLARHTSSHGFGANEAIELGRALDQMPDRLVVYGIEAGGFETGEEISPRVRRAIEETAASIMHDLDEFNVRGSTLNEAGGRSPVRRPVPGRR
jgi:hydrogenase maturation protease